MPQQRSIVELLEEIGLISAAQAALARQDQARYPQLPLEEIVVLHGWVRQETLQFLLEQWPHLAKDRLPTLPEFLKHLGLISEEQLGLVKRVQARTGVSMEELVVAYGWVQQETLNFYREATVPPPPVRAVQNMPTGSTPPPLAVEVLLTKHTQHSLTHLVGKTFVVQGTRSGTTGMRVCIEVAPGQHIWLPVETVRVIRTLGTTENVWDDCSTWR
ncbi:hypothetical protein [Anthocerotibacter panamensis]|uniref:hypothetical protein n=1 Tax=Anthocerotibacter panamensis TaxID=2857077 RepID=UPI001C408948|nr:hypothetical protein [Anthocerotibacter panamensis]